MEISDLPEEVLLCLLDYLDIKSMKSCSHVCFVWRFAVHTLCWRRLCKIANDDLTSKKGLERWGWRLEKHDLAVCSCVDICLGKFPWTKMESTKFMIITEKSEAPKLESRLDLEKMETLQDEESFESEKIESIVDEDSWVNPSWAITPDKVVVTVDNDYKSISTQVLDRRMLNPPQCLQEFEEDTQVHLYSFDNTLVILRCRFSSCYLDNFTVSIWNVNTLEFVMDIDFLNELLSSDSDSGDYLKSEISDVAIEENMLALHIYGSGLLGSMLPTRNITVFFSLDTKAPQKENILFLTKVKQPITKEGFTDCGFIYMNKHLFARSGQSETDTVIQCFDMESIKTNRPSSFYLSPKNLRYCDDVDSSNLCLKLEPGKSSKLAILYPGLDRKKLIIFDTKEKVEIANLDLVGNFFPRCSNWCAGNFFLVSRGAVFIKIRTQNDYDDDIGQEAGFEDKPVHVVFSKKSTVDILQLNDPCLSSDLHIDLLGVVAIQGKRCIARTFKL